MAWVIGIVVFIAVVSYLGYAVNKEINLFLEYMEENKLD